MANILSSRHNGSIKVNKLKWKLILNRHIENYFLEYIKIILNLILGDSYYEW